MKAISFLMQKKMKNTIKQFCKKPSKMIVLIFFIALMSLQFFTSNITDDEFHQFRSMGEFYAIVLGMFTFMFILVAYTGFSSGSTIFTMPDVNLLFLTPIKQRRILNYGMVQGMLKSILTGFFIIFQYSWLYDVYGVLMLDLIYVIIGYAATLFIAQMLAMVIYSVTCNSESKKKVAKAIFFGVFGVFVAYILVGMMKYPNDKIEVLVTLANSTFMHFLPVVGVLRLGVVGLIEANIIYIAISIVAILLFVALFYFTVSKIKFDFYEDVLQSTEVAHSAIKAQKEGKLIQELSPKDIKVGEIGINKGVGSEVFLEKQKIENRRRKVFVFDLTTIIFMATLSIFSLFTKNLIPVIVMCTYLTCIFAVTSSWMKELMLPYIYLIPESSMKKLFNVLKLEMSYRVVQSIVIYIPILFILKLSIIDFLLAVSIQITVSLFVIAINLFLKRFIGATKANAFAMLIYFFLFMLFAIPSIAVGATVFTVIKSNAVIAVLLGVITNLITSIILIFTSRKLLQYADV